MSARSILLIASLFLGVPSLAAQGAPQKKQPPPPPRPLGELKFPSYQEFTLPNGLEIVVIEHHEQPVVALNLTIKRGEAAVPSEKVSLAGLAATLLDDGSKRRSGAEIAEEIDFLGADLSANAGDDFTTVSMSFLAEQLERGLAILREVVTEPVFPAEELERERKRLLSALEVELSQPQAVANRQFARIVYGEHPYSRRPLPETVKAITRGDLVAFHQRNYVANNALLAVVGDVSAKKVEGLVKKALGKWRRATPDPVLYPEPPARQDRVLYFFHKPGAVQATVLAGNLALPQPTSLDFYAATVMNRVLGGGVDARLFLNLREKRGWTYGAYSQLSRPLDRGFFGGYIDSRTEVSDSALVELLNELERIRTEPVPEGELKNAKAFLTGSFPLSIETPSQIAGQVVTTKLLGLPSDYLETYRQRVEAITPQEVQATAQKYIQPEQAAIILVGDATKLLERVKPIARVELYDLKGNPLKPEDLVVKAAALPYDLSTLKGFPTQTYNLMAMGQTLGQLAVSLTVEEAAGVKAFRLKKTISGMMNQDQTLTFLADDLRPLTSQMTMQQGPMTIESSLTYEGKRVKGKVSLPPQMGGEKSIDTEVVEGVLDAGQLDIALMALPLEMGKTYTIPVFSPQQGGLVEAKARVAGEETLTIAGQTFETLKVEVEQGPLQVLYFFSRGKPHRLIKQEIPAQGVTLELVPGP